MNSARKLQISLSLLILLPMFFGSVQAGGDCSPEGTWLGKNEDIGADYILTIVPLRQAQARFSVVSDGGPTALVPKFRGEARRSGHGRYDTTQVALARIDENGLPSDVGTDIVIVATGLMELGDDCDLLAWTNQVASVFLLGVQDPFEDEPIATFPPSSAFYRRVPVLPQED